MKKAFIVIALVLSGCVQPEITTTSQPGQVRGAPPPVAAGAAAANFRSVVARMEPLIENECRARGAARNCDFQIVVDSRPGQPPNAYQTLGPNGRPIIAFTTPLIAEARNTDELAFVLGHEAAHHIARHLPRQQQTALAGALVLGALTAAGGGDATAIRNAQDIGGTLGARRYAKDYELEADALGTVLAWRAGYDPERGAAFFSRIPDPGNQFLGTHPPNAARIAVVRQTLASLR